MSCFLRNKIFQKKVKDMLKNLTNEKLVQLNIVSDELPTVPILHNHMR